MIVVSRPRSSRRSLVHSLLGRSAALLLVLSSGCAQTVARHDAPQPMVASKNVGPAQDAVSPSSQGDRESAVSDQKADPAAAVTLQSWLR